MSQDLLVDGTVDIRAYLRPLFRQWRLIVATTLVVTVLAALYSFTRTSIYTAKTTVLVKPTGINLLDTGALGTAKLINLDTEVQVVGSTDVAKVVATALGSGATAVSVLKHESASAVATSQAIEISYSDPSPSVAAAGANAFANSYIEYRQTQAEALVKAQNDKITSDITAAQAKITADNKIVAASPPSSAESQTAKADRAQAQTQIGLDNTKAATLALVNTDPGQVLEKAQAPKSPSSPKHLLDLALGLFFGFGLGVAAAFVLGRADQHVREAAELEDALGAPSLATIPNVEGPQAGTAGLVAANEPGAPASEAYRALRTTLMATMGSDSWTLLVASPLPGEGKTTVASNLAVMLAKAGKRVVLVSADLRQPRLHELFGLSNRYGLSDILRGRRTLEECMLPTDFPNLIVCPSGPVAPNPAELLQSEDMATFIDVLRKAADFVVIDCPPVLVVADTLGLVPMADGVILVADSTTTQRRAIVEARSHLGQVGTRVFGGVLNKVAAPGPGGYGYGYGPVSGGES